MKLPFRQHHLLRLLEEYCQKQLPLDALVNYYFRKHKALGSKDRAYIAQTAYDIIRWQALLDALSDKPSNFERLKTFEKIKETLSDPVKAYKNRFPLHVCLSFPKDLFSSLACSYGEEKAIQLCLASQEAAPTFLRVNTLKITRDELLKSWKDLPARASKKSLQAIIFDKKMNFFQLEEFKKGFFEVQDEGSQLIAALVKAKPGDQFMDYCAGSGGKTLAIAPQMANQGQIYLHDIRKGALLEARKRLRRAGVGNAQIVYNQSPNMIKLKKNMDWVLVDAPCSGTGTLRRNPDMKWRFNLEMLDRLVKEQRVIFEKALSYVKPGGYIVFATCSVLKEENENQTQHFLKTYSLKLIGKPFKTLPEYGNMDGFYGVVFKK